MMYYVGTSGFTLQQFYPTGLASDKRLEFYAGKFNTVEINTTFYHVPRLSTVQGWLSKVPSDFVFTFKVHQSITHVKDHRLDLNALSSWFETFAFLEMSPKKHVMLFQFPASYIFDVYMLQDLLTQLPRCFRYAFEFRHWSWFTETTYSTLRRYGATMVWSDAPNNRFGKPMWPKVEMPDMPFLFMRFHGSQKLYYSSYTEEELEKAADIAFRVNKDVFAYFNNDAAAHASENAVAFRKLFLN